LETNSEDKRLSAPEQISKIFAIVMVVLYFGLGTTIIFKAPDIRNYIPLFQNTPVSYIQALGIITLCYGLFRGYKVYRHYYSESED
jgi:hypothetical protein